MGKGGATEGRGLLVHCASYGCKKKKKRRCRNNCLVSGSLQYEAQPAIMQNPKSSSRLGLRHVVYLWHCCAPLPLFVGNFNLTKGTLLSILLLSVYCFTLHISKTCRRSVTACEFKTCAKSHIILFPIQIFLMCMS